MNTRNELPPPSLMPAPPPRIGYIRPMALVLFLGALVLLAFLAVGALALRQLTDHLARVLVQGKPIGFVGELHPQWRQSWELPQVPVLFELDVPALAARQVPRFSSVPKMQSVHRDLALVVADQTSFEALMAAIHEAPTEGLVRDARLFDIYKPKTPVAGIGDNERSLAVRVSLRDDEQTLNDERIDAAMKAVLNSLSERVGARVRA